MDISTEKIKSIIIAVLVCIVVVGGTYMSSELMYYKNNCSISASDDVFESIDIERYLSLLQFSNLSLIYISKSDCEYSQAQNLVFEDVKELYGNIKIYNLELDKLDNDAIELLYSSYDTFIDDGINTPTMLLVQSGEVKAFKKGYTSFDNLILFLEDNSFILE